MSDQHPIRAAEIRIFKRVDGPEHVGRFSPYDTYPVLFTGTSEADVRGKMEAFANEVAEKNETAFLNRKAAIEKARAARKKKGADE